jgi:ribosomal protein L7/L12
MKYLDEKYHYRDVDDVVIEVIKKSYKKYFELFLQNRKLMFLKTMRDDTGLSLRESKYTTDVLFDGGEQKFNDTLNIKEQRRKKIKKLNSLNLSKD